MATTNPKHRIFGIIELVDRFFRFLSGDYITKSSLYNCSLVCRSWTPLAQARLFRNVSFRMKRTQSIPFDFRQFLLSSPHVRPMIRSLHLNGCFYAEYKDMFSDSSTREEAYGILPLSLLKSLLQELPRLRDLSLVSLLLDSSDLPPASTNDHLPDLDTLTMQNTNTRSYHSLQDAINIFLLFSTIKTCKLISFEKYSHRPEHQPDYFSFPEDVKIASLHIGPKCELSQVERLFKGVSKSSSLARSISSLDLKCIDYPGINIYGRFLQLVGPQLESLCIDLTNVSTELSAWTPKTIAKRLYMFGFHDLKEIHIGVLLNANPRDDDGVERYSTEALDLLGDIFSQIPHDTLNSIKLICQWTCKTEFLCEALKSCNWTPFRNALVSLSRLKSLEVSRLVIRTIGIRQPPVKLLREPDPQITQVFEEILPMLKERGVLTFPVIRRYI